MVKCGFSQRRKTIANAISSQLGIDKQVIYTSLKEIGQSKSARIEQLDMEQLIQFSKKING